MPQTQTEQCVLSPSLWTWKPHDRNAVDLVQDLPDQQWGSTVIPRWKWPCATIVLLIGWAILAG